MPYRCNSNDLPASWKAKNIIFYAQGLKIYGVLPYLLHRRLKAEFYSNYGVPAGTFRGGGIIAPAVESNYTFVPYNQSPELIKALYEWLMKGKMGLYWAIAVEFEQNIRCSTAFSSRSPEVWSPACNDEGWQEGFSQAMQGLPPNAIQNLLEGRSDVG